MGNNKDMFNAYIKYFPTINKSMKLIRNGRIRVTDNKTNEAEVYNDWEKLNEVYRLLPVDKPEVETVKEFKYWAYGDPFRSAELRKLMEDKYFEVCGKVIKMDTLDFKKKDWVYFIGPKGDFCQSSNDMVIQLLKTSSDWMQLKLDIKKYTKADIAKLIGLPVDQFVIV